MMETKIELVGFDYAGTQEAEEISRNLHALFATAAGTCAGDRSYGINQTEFVGRPAQVAENLIALEAIEKVLAYEPRADVDSVACSHNTDGKLVAVIRIIPGGSE